MSEKFGEVRNGLFCCLVFLGCYLVAWPVAQMPLNDDFSYIETARVFAQSGHLVYNGWASPILGWMIPWGALFIKVFGFSFMAVKLSMLPVALGCLLLFHAILRRFEVTPQSAVLGTLTLGLSPLFLPLSASFMTDVPGLFAILLCLYLCQRALAAKTNMAAIGWLAAAALTNTIGGTARQVAWLGVLVMVPCAGWLMRKRRGLPAATIALWAAGLIAILVCMHWFAQQPYTVPVSLVPPLPHTLRGLTIDLILTVDLYGSFLLSLLLFVFPVLVVWLFELDRKLDTYLAVICVGVLPPIAMILLLGKFAEVWPPQILIEELAIRKHGDQGWIFDLHHSVVPLWMQVVISTITLAALLGLLMTFQKKKRETAHPQLAIRQERPGC